MIAILWLFVSATYAATPVPSYACSSHGFYEINSKTCQCFDNYSGPTCSVYTPPSNAPTSPPTPSRYGFLSAIDDPWFVLGVKTLPETSQIARLVSVGSSLPDKQMVLRHHSSEKWLTNTGLVSSCTSTICQWTWKSDTHALVHNATNTILSFPSGIQPVAATMQRTCSDGDCAIQFYAYVTDPSGFMISRMTSCNGNTQVCMDRSVSIDSAISDRSTYQWDVYLLE